ncbi:MAG: S8 family serine peptidase [Pseudomonadota bacterium]
MRQLIRSIPGLIYGTLLLAGCSGGGGSDGGSADPTSTVLTVSGVLLSDPILDVDSDINDPEAIPQTNDSIITAQTIAAGSEVRGYVTAEATDDDDSDDNFALFNDESDFYEATISAGQSLVMTFSDYQTTNPAAVDLDLYLYDQSGNLVNGSILIASPTEQVTVSQSGSYFIEVNAFRNSSNYSLALTEAAQTGPQSSAQVNLASMAPRRATAMRDDISAFSNVLQSMTASTPATASTLASKGRDRPRSMWVTETELPLSKRGALSGQFPLASVLGANGNDQPSDDRHHQKLALLRHIKQTNSLAGDDVVRPYHYPRYSAAAPQDPDLQWNLPAIEWQEALTEVELSAPAIGRPLIAVIDSGVFSSHPKIAPVLTDARDFVPRFIDGDAIDDALALSQGGNAAEADDNVELNDPNPDDCYVFHGTHVASIATAPSAGGTIDGTNMDGVVPFSDLMMLKVGNSNSPDCAFIVGDVAGAIRYAAGLPNSSGVLPARAADVIAMAFGGPEPDPATEAAIEEAVAAGVILVAAAGNAGQFFPSPEYPAAFNDVFAVAATDINNNRVEYSSFYPEVEIAAPGGNGQFDTNGDGEVDAIIGAIASLNGAETAFDADYALYQGTSMSVPHVAAGFALMKAIYPELDTEEARSVLEEGFLTIDIDAEGRDDNTGFGLMSLKKMVDTAIALRDDTLVVPSDFRVTPSTLTLGNVTASATFTISRSGAVDFTISSVTTNSISAPSGAVSDPAAFLIDADGFGSYEVLINRTDVAPGAYNAEIAVTSSEGTTKTVPLSFDVPAQSTSASTAPTRVILQRENSPGSFTNVTTIVAGTGAGSTVTFSALDPGNYRVLYTTDMDNDGQICDGGELGGSFPGGDCQSTDTISVIASNTNLDFVLTRLDD